jgi:hypothetical protein
VNFLNEGVSAGIPTLIFYPGTAPDPNTFIGEPFGALTVSPDNAIIIYSSFPGQPGMISRYITGNQTCTIGVGPGACAFDTLADAATTAASTIVNGTVFFCGSGANALQPASFQIQEVYSFQQPVTGGSIILQPLQPSPPPVTGDLENIASFLTDFSNPTVLHQVLISPNPIIWYSPPSSGIASVQQIGAATGGPDQAQLIYTAPFAPPYEGNVDPEGFLDANMGTSGYAYLIITDLNCLPIYCFSVISYAVVPPPPPPNPPSPGPSTGEWIAIVGIILAVIIGIGIAIYFLA